MMDLLDAMSELVYIVDIDTYELLYMNASGKEQFKISSLDGLKCHQVIQGRSKPCEFCTTPYLKSDCYYTWETTNPITGRHYLLKDKLFPWQGKHARIEIAFDMTEKQEALEAETLLVSCVENLQLGGQFPVAVKDVLQKLGEFSGAERAYAFETEGSRVLKAHEWCAPGLPPCADQLRGLDLKAPHWYNFGDSQSAVDIYPTEDADSAALSGTSVRIAVIGAAAVHTRNLKMVLKTLANFMTSVLQAEQYQKQLEKLSFIDPLTGVLNRNAFTQALEQEPSFFHTPMGIVHLSVNGIKNINDRNGREYGDQVLINTARNLQSILASAKVYRIGGDEFIAVWENVAGKIFNEHIRQIEEWQKREMTAKFAFGYHWSDGKMSLQELADQAEERMYQDKQEFYRDTVLSKRYRSASDKILDFADGNTLEKMFAEQRFTVYFQPKFSVTSHELIGAEALVRFLTNTGQLLPPNKFIPYLEEARLIERLDFYVFGYVCAKIAEWLAMGKQIVPVSVNFSRYTIKEPWFRDTLIKTWECYCIPKEYVELEITESAEKDCDGDILELLAQLQQDGFSVSIDDFGVKYANLSVFTNGDFSTLKIDKSLISDWENPRTKEILRVICEICQHTEVCLIAEGVESQEQLDFLKQIRCEGVQGYLFSQPLPQREYEQRYLNLA